MPEDMSLTRPVIIVGLPRSGTSFLTRIINKSLQYFVIDDFYIIQRVDALNAWGTLTKLQSDALLNEVFTQIHARSAFPSGMKDLPFDRDDLSSLKDWIDQSDYSGKKWSDLVDALLKQLVKRTNTQNWGYKTPQDHLHIDKLSTAFPTAIFIFVIRDPRDVLLSYKNISREFYLHSEDDLPPLTDDHPKPPSKSAPDGPLRSLFSRLTRHISTELRKLKYDGDDARRYNPYIQGTAWRLAAQSYLRWKDKLPERILLIKYESILENEESILQQIATALDCELKTVPAQDNVTNTSFRPGLKKKPLTDGEIWLADQALGNIRAKLGYTYSAPGFRIQYLPILCLLMLRSGLFFATQFALSQNRRKRMTRVLSQSLFGK